MTVNNPEDLVLYRDGLILVINKPAGMAVHAGRGGKPNLEPYLELLRFGLPRGPELAHRLDASTSGCLVLGRHAKALRKLGSLFASNRIDKTYWAVVHGIPDQAQGRIDLPLDKQNNRKDLWWMQVDPNGKPAMTDYRTLGVSADKAYSWLELKPITGRTHQLRVHCAAMGWPIVGDPIYGRAKPDFEDDYLHLHSRRVVIPLSANKDPIDVEAPLSPAMTPLFKLCGYVKAEVN